MNINELSFILKSHSSKLIVLPKAKTYKVKSKCLFLRPIFFVCQEWAFQMQNFLQSFVMVAGFFFIISPNLVLNLINSPIHFINFAIFIFWVPLLISILGTKFTDLFQLLPVITNLLFLLSPILYSQKNLGKLGLIADLNPVYQVLKLLRDSIIYGNQSFMIGVVIFLINILLLFVTLKIYLNQKNKIVYYL